MLHFWIPMSIKFDLTAETKYQLLQKIANLTRDTLDLDEILNQLLDQVQAVVDYDAAGIFVLNRDTIFPRFARPQGMIAGIVRRGFDNRPPETDPMLSLGKGIIGHVIANGEYLVPPDVRQDKRYVIGRGQTRSEIAVPIKLSDRTIGALNLESDRLDAFSPGDLEVLEFFADAAALSIEKAMLHLQLLDKEHLEEQLQMAREVQSRLLPSAPPDIPGFELAGTSLATYAIGGDYYDYIPLDMDRYAIIVADVSGDGVPAALVMSAFRALLRTQVKREQNPGQLAISLNRLLPEFSGRGDFVTAFLAILDARSRIVQYTNCGHNPALLIPNDETTDKLVPSGPALGVFKDGIYETSSFTLQPGDLLVLYTDGAIEMENAEGEFFGEQRLEQVICENNRLSVGDIQQAVVQATQAFTGQQLYRDDFTLVILKCTRN